MAVFRKIKKTNYTTIDNNIFKNTNLSNKAKGLLCTMLSLPDDWEFSEIGLTMLSNDSRNGIRTQLQELEDNGYLTRTRKRNQNGTLADAEYIVYEDNSTNVPKTNIGKTNIGKKTQLNTKELNTKEINNTTTTISDKFELISNNFGRAINGIEYELINTWEDSELTNYAIKQAVLANKFSIKYIDSILKRYKQENIRTVQEAIDNEEQYKQKTKQHLERPKTQREKDNEFLARWRKEIEDEEKRSN